MTYYTPKTKVGGSEKLLVHQFGDFEVNPGLGCAQRHQSPVLRPDPKRCELAVHHVFELGELVAQVAETLVCIVDAPIQVNPKIINAPAKLIGGEEHAENADYDGTASRNDCSGQRRVHRSFIVASGVSAPAGLRTSGLVRNGIAGGKCLGKGRIELFVRLSPVSALAVPISKIGHASGSND